MVIDLSGHQAQPLLESLTTEAKLILAAHKLRRDIAKRGEFVDDGNHAGVLEQLRANQRLRR
jgi:hypothetical protein